MRFLDKLLVTVALLMFGQALLQAVTKHWDELSGNARRPPPSWQQEKAPPSDRPVPHRPPPGLALLPPPSDRDPTVTINPSPPRQANQRSSGTAFAAGRDGAWLTAKHVVDGCGRVHVRHGQAWDQATVAFADADADIAIVGTYGGVPLLPVSEGPLAVGEDGYAFGFAGQGGPSSIHATLLGRARTLQGGRMAGSTPVLAWAEREWQPPGERWIGGMSGGPLTTADGAVVGIMSVASERRGRIYTVAPEVIGRVMRDRLYKFMPVGAAPVLATQDGFDRARAELMNRRTVVQILCSS